MSATRTSRANRRRADEQLLMMGGTEPAREHHPKSMFAHLVREARQRPLVERHQHVAIQLDAPAAEAGREVDVPLEREWMGIGARCALPE